MKNIFFSILLAVSLIFGSTVTFAGTSPHKNVESQGSMKIQQMKKGLEQPLVVENGEKTWVIHQPKENPKQYFLPTSEGKMAGGQNDEGQNKHQEG
jgi:hypothetical protein